MIYKLEYKLRGDTVKATFQNIDDLIDMLNMLRANGWIDANTVIIDTVL